MYFSTSSHDIYTYVHAYIPMLLRDLHIRRCTGFLAEGLKGRPSNEMVAIKTHEGNGDWDAAIFFRERTTDRKILFRPNRL